jgi:DNA-binding LacI/PurR family transcriptional regulator
MAWMGEWYPAPFFEARQTGFIQGCLGQALNIGEQKFFGCDSFNEKLNLNSSPILDAVKTGTSAFVCANDRVALDIIRLLETNGVRVPEDVSITGFDALRIRASNGKELTTIDPKFIEVGRAAVKLALQRLSDPSASQIKWIISGNEIPGQTVGPKQGQTSYV